MPGPGTWATPTLDQTSGPPPGTPRGTVQPAPPTPTNTLDWLYFEQSEVARVYDELWNLGGGSLEAKQVSEVYNEPTYVPQYTTYGALVESALVDSATDGFVDAARRSQFVQDISPAFNHEARAAQVAELLRASNDVVNFAYRAEEERAWRVNGRRLDERFRITQHMRQLQADSSLLARHVVESVASLEDGRARQEAAVAYFATRIALATDNAGKSVWANVWERLGT